MLINPEPLAALKGLDGRITVTTYTDHLGNLTADCAPVSASCVPLHLTDIVPRGYRLGGQQIAYRDDDVKSP